MLRKTALVCLLLGLCACSTKQAARTEYLETPCPEQPVPRNLLEEPPPVPILRPGYLTGGAGGADVTEADFAAWFTDYAQRAAWLELRLRGWQEWYTGRAPTPAKGE